MSRAVVLDTNVLVAAALKPGSDIADILELVLLRRAPAHVCPSIVADYREVLNRPRLRPKGLPPAWLPRLLQIAFQEAEPAPWPLQGPDLDDLVFLALAKEIGAVLVTGNQADFPPQIREGVIVMSPTACLGQIPGQGRRTRCGCALRAPPTSPRRGIRRLAGRLTGHRYLRSPPGAGLTAGATATAAQAVRRHTTSTAVVHRQR